MNIIFPPVGHIVCRSSDRTCYIQVSGADQITVYFKEAKCVFDGVTPSVGHPFLAKWSPNGNACCFMGKYKGMPRLICIYTASDEKAGLDAWNLGTVPDRVVFKEREGMSDVCVPILKGQEIFKRPFYYDDSIYEFKCLISRSVAAEYPSFPAPQVSPVSTSKTEPTVSANGKNSRKSGNFGSGVICFLKFVAVKLAIGIAFLLIALAVIFLFGTLISLLKR